MAFPYELSLLSVTEVNAAQQYEDDATKRFPFVVVTGEVVQVVAPGAEHDTVCTTAIAACAGHAAIATKNNATRIFRVTAAS